MTLKKTISAYATQIYIALIGLALMPVYLKIMGPELFGLIGIFIALQTFIQTSDLGLSSAVMREASRLIAKKANILEFQRHLRATEGTIVIVSAIALAITIASSGYIGDTLHKYATLTETDTASIIILMVLASLPRLGSGIYKNTLIGLEKQNKTNIISAIFATLRYIGVLPFIILIQPKEISFLTFQIAVSLAELTTFLLTAYASLGAKINKLKPDFSSLKDLWPIAAPMAFLSIAWAALTNIDRIILAKTLNPTEYGYFSLAAIGAAGILTFIVPLSQILLPRMTVLSALNKIDDSIRLFRTATQIITAFFLSLGGTLFIFSTYAIYAWTGNMDITNNSAFLFGWYALANSIAGILYLPFILQFSHGNLRLHFWGSMLSIGIQVPAILWTAPYFGAYGVILTIVFIRIALLLWWTPFVFHKFAPQITYSWLLQDVIPTGLLVLLFTYILHASLPPPENRVGAATTIIICFAATFTLTSLSLNRPRKLFIESIMSTIK